MTKTGTLRTRPHRALQIRFWAQYGVRALDSLLGYYFYHRFHHLWRRSYHHQQQHNLQYYFDRLIMNSPQLAGNSRRQPSCLEFLRKWITDAVKFLNKDQARKPRNALLWCQQGRRPRRDWEDGPPKIWKSEVGDGPDGPCIRPPNILRSSVVGCARKYEESKKMCHKGIPFWNSGLSCEEGSCIYI